MDLYFFHGLCKPKAKLYGPQQEHISGEISGQLGFNNFGNDLMRHQPHGA